MPTSHVYGCVLAGGSGQRFWPLSRELNPKQLLSMFGTESLIAQAVHRILPFTGGGDSVLVVTNERLFDELRNHLTAQPDPELHRVRYIQEPIARNTAPAIALAAATLVAEDPDAIMVVLPSDHLLEDGELWRRLPRGGGSGSPRAVTSSPSASVRHAPRRATATSRPASHSRSSAVETVTPHRVEAEFVEKPDAKRAAEYIGERRVLLERRHLRDARRRGCSRSSATHPRRARRSPRPCAGSRPVS